MRNLAILTGGGDAPGLNAVIRAVVKSASFENNCRVMGVRDGFDGFIDKGGIFHLTQDSVRGILHRGGTIIGAANRGNPFAKKVIRRGKEVVIDVHDRIIENIKSMNLDALIVVGGDGTLRIARELSDLGVPIVGVPKTIDNDIGGTEFTFGFDTAVSIATEALDRLHSTGEAHHRIMILELMGRDAGFISLHAGLAGGADVILIPEIPFNYEAIYKKVMSRVKSGTRFSILAVAEGARLSGEEQLYNTEGDSVYFKRLGGIGQAVGFYLQEHYKMETRVTVLGHLQRGGSPTAFDRWLATRFGAAAVRFALEGKFGCMVALKNEKITGIPLEEALRNPRRVDIYGDTIITARSLGISFGD